MEDLLKHVPFPVWIIVVGLIWTFIKKMSGSDPEDSSTTKQKKKKSKKKNENKNKEAETRPEEVSMPLPMIAHEKTILHERNRYRDRSTELTVSVDRKQVVQAIVWSEILSKPRAYRKKNN
ncbi:hypothetical protein A374_10760 [Fictibacillus macauensis ZFHKF-1]|uniref:Uncharacterized protein n=1 Tax=Fictibacillus macauensis ZFHKF-1 TaxID=1196324 RepID=I8UEH6_9BACL|nr:hypothetical protein [Fictibacillus macauensis]EIT85218.1 hypothetical protein A374_10760 [Fictibacillus macauensis ZFHKF-1]